MLDIPLATEKAMMDAAVKAFGYSAGLEDMGEAETYRESLREAIMAAMDAYISATPVKN